MSSNHAISEYINDVVMAKVKLSLCFIKHHTMKTHVGVEVKLPLDGSEGPISCSLLYCSGMNLQCPLDRRLDGHQNQSGCCGEKKNLLSLL
jgi:hypothetical protein